MPLRRGIESRLLLGLVVVAGVALGIGWLVYSDTNRLTREQAAVARQYEALNALEATFSSLQDVETGERGYLITGNPGFLAPYNDGVARAGQQIGLLGDLSAEDPIQRERLASLETLAAETIRLAGEGIDIHDRLGSEAADRFVASGRGQAAMDEVRAVIRSMEETESEHLQQRTSASDAATRNTRILVGSLAALSLALFTVLLVAITRVLASQRRASEAAARLAATANASNDAIIGIDLDACITQWNAGAERLFGYSASEIVGQSVSRFVSLDEGPVQAANIATVHKGTPIMDQEAVGLAKDGRRIEVSLSAFPVYDASGAVNGSGAVIRDMTERKRAENLLIASQVRWHAIFQESPVAMAIARAPDAVMLDVNQAFCDLVGISRAEILGRTSAQFGDHIAPAHDASLARANAEGGFRDQEMVWQTRNGRRMHLLVSVSTIDLGGERCFLSTNTDITARKQAEISLRDSQLHLAALFNASPAGMSITRMSDGTLLEVNESYLDLFGFAREDATGRTSLEMGMWVDPAWRPAILDRINAERSVRDVEIPWRTRSGRVIHTITSWELLDVGGELCVLTLVSDITKRKEAEEERERVFTLSSDIIAVAGFDGLLRRVNPAVTETLGYSVDEILGHSFFDLLHPDDHAAVQEKTDRLLRGDRSVTFQGRTAAKDGSYRWVELVASADLERELIYAVARDMTGRRAIEEALRASEARFRSIVETAADAVVVADAVGVIEVFNPAAERLFGWAAVEIIGQSVNVLVPRPHNEEFDRFMVGLPEAASTEVLSLQQEMAGKRKDGSMFPYELTVNPMRIGAEVKFTAIIRDMTSRKEMEDELRAAKDAAEEANRSKSGFLSRMSHELRTPLNVVLGFAQVLQLDPLEAPQAEAVDHILTAGRHLLELIDEVLDISRIEAGRLSLSIEPVHAGELLAETLGLMRPLAEQRHVTINSDFPSGGAFILADRHRLKQVLLNLVSNAIKYNKEGGSVTIGSRSTGDSALRIMVTDTGPGIAPENLDRVFNAFDRLGAEATRVDGTGLGLTLSRQLIVAMGGAIGVESVAGRGSTFWVELPLGAPPDSPETKTAPGEQAESDPIRVGGSILYVEDNLANLKLMERVLTQQNGFHLLAAMQGRLGIELARDYRPQLILLDLHLPDMLGSEVLRELKTNPATANIPVVMITADASPGQAALFLDAGARAYLTKPLDLKEFLELTDSILREES